MKPTKHTPGPWTVVHASADGTKIRVRDCEHLKGYLGKFEAELIGEDGPVNWRNARLIAAAPDLLAALELSLSKLQVLLAAQLPKVSHEDTALIRTVEVAIAKARGES